jgi:hypothetical protein
LQVVFERFWLTAFPFADVVDPTVFLADMSKNTLAIVNGTHNSVDCLEIEFPIDMRLSLLRVGQTVAWYWVSKLSLLKYAAKQGGSAGRWERHCH